MQIWLIARVGALMLEDRLFMLKLRQSPPQTSGRVEQH
jgi:hypothetical protein